MKYYKILVFFSLLLAFNCAKPKPREEVLLMNCLYNNFDDNGYQIRLNIRKTQQSLVDMGVLQDTTAVSYLKFYTDLSKNKPFLKTIKPSFLNNVFDIVISESDNSSLANKCKTQLFEQYKFRKLKHLDEVILNISNNKNIDFKDVSDNVLSLLDKEDFKLDYYKIRTFMILDILKSRRKSPSNFRSETKIVNLTKVLTVFMDNKDSYKIDNVMYSYENIIEEIELKIKEKEINEIALKANKLVLYSDYMVFETKVKNLLSSKKEFDDIEIRTLLDK